MRTTPWPSILMMYFKLIFRDLADNGEKQIHDRLYLLRANGTPERLDPDFMGTITVTPHNSGFLASFVNYQTPLLVKNLEFIPGSNYSWKIWRDTNFEQFPLSDFVTAQVCYSLRA